MNYFLIAGEASGDLHAAHLMRELKLQDPEADFRYFGGDLMQKEGGQLLKHYRELAFMGFVPVLMNLKTILRNMQFCKKEIIKYRPDVVILIDYPGFNLKMAKFVKSNLNIPVHYYISPKLWAWKEYRIKSIKKYVDLMLSILPFEVPFYAKHNYEIKYIGNPTRDEIARFQAENPRNQSEFRKRNVLTDKPIVALLAGSRKQEIRKNLPLMLNASLAFPDYQFIVAGAPGISADEYKNYLTGFSTKIVYGETFTLLNHADAALVTSGTATLETALFNVPQAVCYYASGGKILYFIIESLLKVSYVSLVNLIANRLVVKELLGYKASVESLERELNEILNNSAYKQKMLEGYEEVRMTLGATGAPRHAAMAILDALKKKD